MRNLCPLAAVVLFAACQSVHAGMAASGVYRVQVIAVSDTCDPRRFEGVLHETVRVWDQKLNVPYPEPGPNPTIHRSDVLRGGPSVLNLSEVPRHRVQIEVTHPTSCAGVWRLGHRGAAMC
jgi:hypothetical protein